MVEPSSVANFEALAISDGLFSTKPPGADRSFESARLIDSKFQSLELRDKKVKGQGC